MQVADERRLRIPGFLLALLFFGAAAVSAQEKPPAEWDTTKARGQTRDIDFDTSEGTWMALDQSPDGKWIVFDLLGHIYRMPSNGGNAESLTQDSGIALNMQPRYSPDGKTIAFISDRKGQNNLWLMDADGKNPRAVFTDKTQRALSPVWTPDGGKVTYSADRVGHPRAVYWKPSDGSGTEERLFDGQTHPHVSSWSPDGKTLVYTEFDPVFSGDIWTLTLGEKVEPRRWLRTPFNERAPRLSPDGHWLAYVSNESGRDEVYVQPFPGPGGKWQISVSGGTEPVWSHAGSEIFYRKGDKMMAVGVAYGGSFSAGSPHVLFEGRFVPTRRGEAAYDVSPDDRRFVMIQRDLQSVATRLNMVLNFSEELKRRAPLGQP